MDLCKVGVLSHHTASQPRRPRPDFNDPDRDQCQVLANKVMDIQF